ncbi:PXA domain-containing protein [Peziza echinospora]|nr:PXA domain-containing protein [Peziza echinospora]
MSDLAPPSAATPAPTLPPPPPATATAPPPPPPPPLPPQAIIEHQQTLALIRRILRPQSSPSTPLEDILPALTSSPQVDVQLYAFLAYICRDFIFAWYSKITNDRSFVDEVITVIAHTTRSLEQRTRQIDLEVLLLDELPSLLDNHVRDFRQCVARHKTCLSPHLTLEESFHNLQPHPALGSSPESEKLYLKVLASGLLAVLLPPEDLQSNCERTLIREILSGMVFGNVVDKLSEPWMLYEIITKLLAPQPQTPPQLPQPLITLPSPAISMPPTPITPLGDPLDVSHADSSLSPPSPTRSRKSTWPPPPPELRTLSPASAPPPSEPTPPLHPILQKLDSTFALIFNLIMYATTALATLHIFLKPHTPPPAAKKPILRMAIFRCKEDAAGEIPEVVWRHYVSPSATDGKREAIGMSGWILFASKSVNKHLVIQIVELLVGRLAPELAEERAGGVVEGLLGERGVKVG